MSNKLPESTRSLDSPALVISTPKSGTYLLVEVLQRLGFHWTGMHLAEKGYSDYTGADLEEARRNPGRFGRDEPLATALTRIGPGEFAVGHLACNNEVIRSTSRFRRIFVTRDLRANLISYMRFLHNTGRLGAEQLPWYPIAEPRRQMFVFLATSAPYMLQRFYESLVGWSQVDGVLHVRFEDFTGAPERGRRAIDALADHLGITNCDAGEILSHSLSAETITKSSGLSRLEEYWSPAAEKQFRAIGGPELEARLCSPSVQNRGDLAGGSSAA